MVLRPLSSTKPGQSEGPVVILCFANGTEKIGHWPKINRTVGTQVTHLRQPDGEFTPRHGRIRLFASVDRAFGLN